jgi:hypothetical protein
MLRYGLQGFLSHWSLDLNPIPLKPNLQAIGGVLSSPTKGINRFFWYDD